MAEKNYKLLVVRKKFEQAATGLEEHSFLMDKVKVWPRPAASAGVPRSQRDAIGRTHRNTIDRRGVLKS
jgi:hypothetical protein